MNLLRYLQGERPGMRAGEREREPFSRFLLLLSPRIQISGSVRLADVSYYQGAIDFVKMKAEGIAGVIIRAGQRSWVDIRFRENWGKAKAAGMPRGSYWLYDSRAEPKAQAALWWSQVQADPGELVHVADLEEAYGGAYGSKAHIKIFLAEFQRLSGLPARRIAIYTGYFWWVDRIGNDPYFKQFPLWLAWYADMSVVRVPAPWQESDLLLWQYTSSGDGLRYGVSSQEIDLNYYCCDRNHFVNRFGVVVDTPAPPSGGPMWYRVNAVSGLNIRRGPGLSYQDIGDLQHGDLVEAAGPAVGGWINIKSALRAGAPLILPDPLNSWCKDSYLVAIDPPVPPPDPEPVVQVPFTLSVQGFKPYSGELERE